MRSNPIGRAVCLASNNAEPVKDEHRAFSAAPVNDGRWHHLVCIFENKEMMLYVDGELTDFKSGPNVAPTNNSAPLLIGKRMPSKDATTPQPYRGLIDELRIYQRALNENEIRHLAAIE
jgi:hypothetical protein